MRGVKPALMSRRILLYSGGSFVTNMTPRWAGGKGTIVVPSCTENVSQSRFACSTSL